MDTKEYLKEWAVQYLKSKDVIARKIKEISIQETVKVAYINKDLEVFSIASCSDLAFLASLPKEKYIMIITLNTHENLKGLMEQWKSLASYQNLSLMFINPFSSEGKWIIHPYTHDRIADPSSLRLGLTSLFEAVGELKPEQISLVQKEAL